MASNVLALLAFRAFMHLASDRGVYLGFGWGRLEMARITFIGRHSVIGVCIARCQGVHR